ncbi:hypothetical protein [Microbispora siamensis]|uniref:Tetratricopeptide repeat protein n=1 Tax=Microbispora siamensis TaxID=564413 RepID=A0ABQ4H1H9_9ACTN|nr:hypothetical protein [Microbispora siamensis]GIH67556.1 hypothetical protein Msi02_83730 [Microbispora siamensis]
MTERESQQSDMPDNSAVETNDSDSSPDEERIPLEEESSTDETISVEASGASMDDIDRLLLDAPRNQRSSLIRDHLAERVGDDSLEWIDDLARRAANHGLTIHEVRSIVTDLAWISRDRGERLPSDTAPVPSSAGEYYELFRLVRSYALGQRLRFDFKFDSLRDVSQHWLSEFDNDALILSFVAFAALGLRLPHGLDLYERAINAPDADRRTRHVCLAGMWLAYHVEGQAEKMLELSGQMMAKGEIDENVFFRRASALRKLKKYEQALQEIDHAIHMLGIGNNAVHQDYVRERESIILSMQLQRHADSLAASISAEVVERAEKRIEDASAALTNRIETAQRVVSDSLLKIVEILGLFVTLAGFLIGSGVVVFKSSTFNERIISMAMVIVGSLVFFVLLRVVTGFRRKERHGARSK